MLPPFSSSRQRTSGSRQPMACLMLESGQRSPLPTVSAGVGRCALSEGAVRRRRRHDRFSARRATSPEAEHDNPEPVADNEVEYVDSSRDGAQREERRDEELTNDAAGATSPPDTATDRDSRLPPSNPTRTCNKLPDVYM